MKVVAEIAWAVLYVVRDASEAGMELSRLFVECRNYKEKGRYGQQPPY